VRALAKHLDLAERLESLIETLNRAERLAAFTEGPVERVGTGGTVQL
jgi:hypothetical protein